MGLFSEPRFVEKYNRDENNVTAKVFAGILANELVPGNEDLQLMKAVLRKAEIPIRDTLAAGEIEVTLFPQADDFGIPSPKDPTRLDSGELGDVVIAFHDSIVAIECKYCQNLEGKVREQLKRQSYYLSELRQFRHCHQLLIHVDYRNRQGGDWARDLPDLRVLSWWQVAECLPPSFRELPFWGKRNAREIPRRNGGVATTFREIQRLTDDVKQGWALLERSQTHSLLR